MEAKINLEKLNEKDWEKYRKMDKVARRTKGISADTVVLIGLTLIIIVFLVIIEGKTVPEIAHLNNMANYSFNQLTTSIHSSQIGFTNNNTLSSLLSNSSVSRLITVLSSNPKALSAFIIYLFLEGGIFALGGGFVIVIMFILMYFNMLSTPTPIKLPHTYKQLQMCKNIIKESNSNLTTFGFTREEINWYYMVRSELIKLKIDSIL